MGKIQSKPPQLPALKNQQFTTSATQQSNSKEEDSKEEELKITERKDLVISFNEDFTQIDVNKEKRGTNRRMSRLEKLKIRKLPHTLRIQIIREDDEAEEGQGEDTHSTTHKSSDHHMSHLEKIKQRKMPAGKRLFGDHYVE